MEEWDICNPKVNHERVKDAKLSPYMAGRFLRAEAAQNNGFITLPFFAAAIVSFPLRHMVSTQVPEESELDADNA